VEGVIVDLHEKKRVEIECDIIIVLFSRDTNSVIVWNTLPERVLLEQMCGIVGISAKGMGKPSTEISCHFWPMRG